MFLKTCLGYVKMIKCDMATRNAILKNRAVPTKLIISKLLLIIDC